LFEDGTMVLIKVATTKLLVYDVLLAMSRRVCVNEREVVKNTGEKKRYFCGKWKDGKFP